MLFIHHKSVMLRVRESAVVGNICLGLSLPTRLYMLAEAYAPQDIHDALPSRSKCYCINFIVSSFRIYRL